MRVAVLGGGLTGLTAAWRLAAAGHEIRLIEGSPRLGGSVRTERAQGWLVESGPNSYQENPDVAALVGELGLAAERVEASPSALNRYIALGGSLIALPSPSSPAAFAASTLLSPEAKRRVSAETDIRPRERAQDASVADLARDHFGSDVLERIVQPFVGGIFAGDAEQLSARHAFPRLWEAERTRGSLLRALAEGAAARRAAGLAPSPALASFRGGMQALTDALAGALPSGSATLNARVTGIGPGAGARLKVEWSGPEGAQSAEADWVVATLPAWALAEVAIGSPGVRPLSGLGAIPHPPVASVFLGYRREQVRHALDGFGALVPAGEKRSILGVIFTSTLFEDRAPEGHVALTALAGGALQPGIARLPADELARRVRDDLAALLGAEGEPVFLRQAVWPRAIPQYILGYGAHLDAMAACERENPGLLIGGSARDGISIPECVRSGASLAQRVS